MERAAGPTGGYAEDAERAAAEALAVVEPVVPARSRRGVDIVGMSGLLAEAREHLDARGGTVVLTGPPGIGKSTLLERLADDHAGRTVLRCAPAESESQLPFLGLIDLLSTTGDDVLDLLPGHQRAVLKSALLRGGDPPPERGPLPLRLAVLDLFRVLCARSPVLLVIDDAQWLDGPSAELLAFVARRAAGLPLRALVAVRTDPRGRYDAGFCPGPVHALNVPGLTVAEVSQLLGDRWPRPVVTQVHEVSGGNPFFALELGRALAETPPDSADDSLPLPDSLRDLMLDRLGTLSEDARRTLLTASAAARPTLRLLRAAGRDGADEDVAAAVRDGIVEIGSGEVVRFTHPLLAAVVYAEADPGERHAAHAELAGAVTDPVERARHRALIAPGPDAELASALDEAAVAARRRGAPAEACRLGRLAAEHTQPDDTDGFVNRLLTASEDAIAAGDLPEARRIAHEALAVASEPAPRVRGWLAVIDSAGQALAEFGDIFPRALADAGDDPALLAPLHYRLAWRAWLVEGSAFEAHEHAARSAELAARAGDRRTEILALAKQAHLGFFLGRPDAEKTLARALSSPQDPRVMVDHNGPAFQRYRHHLLADRLEEARAELRSLIYLVRRRGAVESLCHCLHNLARVEVHRGRCDRALDVARQSLRLAEDSDLSQGPSWFSLALAEAAGGDADRAVDAARRAEQHSADDGDLLFLPQAWFVAGHIHLMAGRNDAAVALLRRVRRSEEAQGLGDPAMRRWHGDLAEALALSGNLDEAAELIEETRARATRLERRVMLAVMDRAAALVAAGRGDGATATALARRSATALAELPFRLEEGRSWLVLGRLRLGQNDAAGARSALREARRVFAHAHARPWLALVTAELDRVRDLDRAAQGPSAPSAALGVLSAMEAKVAGLVAEGATNREIAARLFISVKTVEAALTRTYRKLGVRSRVDLARLASSPYRPGQDPPPHGA